MPPYLARLAYMSEFLLALVAILNLWSEVGGQGHLDLMPWYIKMVLTVALGLVTVAGTASAVTRERAWNAHTIVYLLLALMLAGAMAGVTYYYHLHENDDDCSDDRGLASSRLLPLALPALRDRA
jgi:hypothetical protein